METVFRYLRARGIDEISAALLSIAIVAALCVHRDYARALLGVVGKRVTAKKGS